MKKTLAIFLSFCLLLSLAPMALAAEEPFTNPAEARAWIRQNLSVTRWYAEGTGDPTPYEIKGYGPMTDQQALDMANAGRELLKMTGSFWKKPSAFQNGDQARVWLNENCQLPLATQLNQPKLTDQLILKLANSILHLDYHRKAPDHFTDDLQALNFILTHYTASLEIFLPYLGNTGALAELGDAARDAMELGENPASFRSPMEARFWEACTFDSSLEYLFSRSDEKTLMRATRLATPAAGRTDSVDPAPRSNVLPIVVSAVAAFTLGMGLMAILDRIRRRN